jgi:hypothetical protein
MPEQFSEADKTKVLLWCDRHCCLCGKACGTDIEVAHIDPEGSKDADNAIPLCYDCHAEIGRYNEEHPRGNKYKPEELKSRRDQIYEKYTRHLVPPIHFVLTQKRIGNQENHKLPFVGFHLQHFGDSLPVNIRVEARLIVDGKDLGLVESEYYNGKTKWNINPRTLFWGGFGIPKKYTDDPKDLKIEVRVTVIDQYEREHRLLPQCYRYIKEGDFWNLEPRSFIKWTD